MRFLLFIVFIALTSLSLEAQAVDRTNFRAGLNGGLVVGDFSDAYSFTLGLDIYHHWGVSKEIDLGIAAGFSNAFGETQELSTGIENGTLQNKFANAQFLPVAGSVRIYPTSGFKFGGDVGYAVSLTDGIDGGLYYRPSIGIDMNGGSQEFNISYYVVNGDETMYSSVLAGFLILF